MKWVPAILVFLLGVACLRCRHDAQRDLRQQIAQLKAQAAPTEQNGGGKSVVGDIPEELVQLRRDHQELLRLRGEIGGMRERGRLTPENLEKRIQDTQREEQEAQREAGLVEARKKAADESKQMLNSLNSYASMAMLISQRARAPMPSSWDEIPALLDRPWLPDGKRSQERMDRMRAASRRWYEESRTMAPNLRKFEFVQGSRAGQLLLREVEPRALPDGGWARAYAFLNGDVHEATSESGDFTHWEEEAVRQGPPPRQPPR